MGDCTLFCFSTERDTPNTHIHAASTADYFTLLQSTKKEVKQISARPLVDPYNRKIVSATCMPHNKERVRKIIRVSAGTEITSDIPYIHKTLQPISTSETTHPPTHIRLSSTPDKAQVLPAIIAVRFEVFPICGSP